MYFNPTVYRISQTTKNYESYNVNNVDVDENYGLREREDLVIILKLHLLGPPLLRESLMHPGLVLNSLCTSKDDLEDFCSPTSTS